eukprot:NODE_22_length_38364_cov_0.248661.p8 type:complete len:413 gc:universal NODE_22_length_38364_cov_0.248661:864-2102(+)
MKYVRLTTTMSNWFNYLALEIISLTWVAGWIIASYINRMDAVIAKRGFLNTVIFSIVLLVCWSENLLVNQFYDLWLIIPCPVHLYANYMFFGLFMFIYSVRGVCLLYEKNSGLIKILNEDELHLFIQSMNFFEKSLTRMKSLTCKLRRRDKNATREQVIEAHFNQTRFFKPRFLLYCSLLFLSCGAIIGGVVLEFNSQTAANRCTFSMYIFLYSAIGVMMALSFFVAYLLRKASDPYFMKYEFSIFMCFVMPFCYILGISSRAAGVSHWEVFIVITLGFSHFISVVIPNVIGFRNRKLRIQVLKTSRSSGYIDELDMSELKKKAAERFCVELVLFKEDYNKMKLLKDEEKVNDACCKMYKSYLTVNSPLEININYDLLVMVRKGHQEKNYEIMDTVMAEVNYILYSNLGIHQ